MRRITILWKGYPFASKNAEQKPWYPGFPVGRLYGLKTSGSTVAAPIVRFGWFAELGGTGLGGTALISHQEDVEALLRMDRIGLEFFPSRRFSCENLKNDVTVRIVFALNIPPVVRGDLQAY